MNIDGQKSKLTTHIRWYLRHGYWPKQINHHCDNPACVRLSHLYEGTHAENMADKVWRGRSPRCEKHWKAKLTPRQAYAIRALVRWGSYGTQAELARKYDVSRKTISMIISRKHWGGLPLTENLEKK